MSIALIALALALALCSAYLLGEWRGSKHVYEPLPPATLSPTEEVGVLASYEIVDPATVPVTVVSVEEILATEKVAVHQTELANRYRRTARRLSKIDAEWARLDKLSRSEKLKLKDAGGHPLYMMGDDRQLHRVPYAVPPLK